MKLSRSTLLRYTFLAFLLVFAGLLLVIETLAMFVHTWRRRRPEEKHTVLT